MRNILQLLSGFEITNFIRDLIKPNEMKYFAEKYFVGLKNLSKPINNVKPKNKHYFYRPLKFAHLRLNELNKMGFKISKKLWSSCKRSNPRLVGGRPPLANYRIDAIKDLMIKSSAISSHRTILVRKRKFKPSISNLRLPRLSVLKKLKQSETIKSIENVRYNTQALNEMYEKLLKIEELSNENPISFSSFRKYIKNEKIFLKPKNVKKF